MDDRPSFRNRRYVRQLLFALLLPWALGAVAYSFPLPALLLHRAGLPTDWMKVPVLIGFYSFGFPSLLALPAAILFGIWRLIRYREHRCSWYGWAWPVLTWLNMWAAVPVLAH